MILANNFAEVLKEFNSNGVSYLISGGYAVIFHGYVRTTGDIDIWVKPDSNNKDRLVRALKKLTLSIKLVEYLQDIDFTSPFSVKLGDEPLQMDIFNAVTGLRFEEAFENSIPYQFQDGLEVRFIQLEDLIKNKMLTGRMKDKADVEELQKIRKYRNRK
jgi:predicted nucleotidyltransferase